MSRRSCTFSSGPGKLPAVVFMLFLSFFPTLVSSSGGRSLQAAVYSPALNKAFFVGGQTVSSPYSRDTFSLDLSKAFIRSQPPWSYLAPSPYQLSDAASVLGDDGQLYVLGGESDDCSHASIQIYDTGTGIWRLSQFSEAPFVRRGARAIMQNSTIYYFGGKTTNCSATEYMYNTLYAINPKEGTWRKLITKNPPVAQINMALSGLSDGNLLLIGGETVSSNKVSFVGLSQIASFNTKVSSWTYLPTMTNVTVDARSGHSAVSSGDVTYIYGGAVNGLASTPTFITMTTIDGSTELTPLDPSNQASAPPSLVGHSSILTKNGFMILCFGTIVNTTNLNKEVYIYDIHTNAWIDRYDPLQVPVYPISSRRISHLSLGAIAAIIATSVAFVVAFLILGIVCYRRYRRHRIAALCSNEFVPSVARAADNGCKHPQASVYLPPWAALYARANSRHDLPFNDASTHQRPVRGMAQRNPFEDPEMEVQNRMVQVTSPPSPQLLCFTAPRMELRITNPSSSYPSPDVEAELIQTDQAGTVLSSSLLGVTSEEDLEALRNRLVQSPIISCFGVQGLQEQLSGLGLYIDERCRPESRIGTIRRVFEKALIVDRHESQSCLHSSGGYAAPSRTEGLCVDQAKRIFPAVKADHGRGSQDDLNVLASYSPYSDSPQNEILAKGYLITPPESPVKAQTRLSLNKQSPYLYYARDCGKNRSSTSLMSIDHGSCDSESAHRNSEPDSPSQYSCTSRSSSTDPTAHQGYGDN